MIPENFDEAANSGLLGTTCSADACPICGDGLSSHALLCSSELPENTDMPKQYSTQDKLAGRDLHGLACRVPEPTPEQANCSHSEWVERDHGFENWMTGEWVSDIKRVEDDTFEDIPGTNNFRCTQCGYTRRY